jgi:hypothetical protein
VQAAPRELRKREQDCYNTVEKEETRRQKIGGKQPDKQPSVCCFEGAAVCAA